MSRLLGIAREVVYSPGKVEADRAVLEDVAARLRSRHRVRVVEAAEAEREAQPPEVVFAMCQGPPALALLRRWEKDGVRVVNSVAAVEGCHRHRMLEAFRRHGVRYPESRLVGGPDDALPDWFESGAWLKRGDVHATETGDVLLARDRAAARRVLEAFRRRGIGSALMQRHVPGDVFKFYAVRGRMFRYVPGPGSAGLPASEQAAMALLAAEGAAALGLEVYGGDVVRDAAGGLWLIDLNDWPSYGPCRFEAAKAIAELVDAHTR